MFVDRPTSRKRESFIYKKLQRKNNHTGAQAWLQINNGREKQQSQSFSLCAPFTLLTLKTEGRLLLK